MIPELNWASMHGHFVLVVPGPIEIPFRMLQALAQPPQVQYGIAFGEGVLEPLTLTLRHVYQTEHEGILLRGSGRMGSDGSAEAQEQFKGDKAGRVKPWPHLRVALRRVRDVRTIGE